MGARFTCECRAGGSVVMYNACEVYELSMAPPSSRDGRGGSPFQKGDPSSQPPRIEEKRLLLYVDDDESNREVMRLRMRSRFDIILAANDREAVKALELYGNKFHALLLD